jgi:hypothetical protein
MYSHPDVDSLSAVRVGQRSRKAKHNRTSVRERSRKPKFLGFLYSHMGDNEEERDTIAAFLPAHGYRLAPCTIDNTDYKFDETYVLAPARQLARASVAAPFRGGSAFSISLVSQIGEYANCATRCSAERGKHFPGRRETYGWPRCIFSTYDDALRLQQAFSHQCRYRRLSRSRRPNGGSDAPRRWQRNAGDRIFTTAWHGWNEWRGNCVHSHLQGKGRRRCIDHARPCSRHEQRTTIHRNRWLPSLDAYFPGSC